MSQEGADAAAQASGRTANPKKNTNIPSDSNASGKKNNKRSRHQRRNHKKEGGTNSGQSSKPMSEKKLSHSLSWALRHAALQIGLTIKEDGYVPVQEILDSTHPKLRGATLENIQQVVQNSDKQRFKLQERPLHLYYPESTDTEKMVLCIRANQGHSISIINPESLLRKLSPDELRGLPCIVHGTYPEAWESIQKSGLKKMNRTHIHFATGLPADDGVISGMRKSCSVYIFLDPMKCAADDRIRFFMSDNGVVLTDGVSGVLPIEFFSHVTGSSGDILFDNRIHDAK